MIRYLKGVTQGTGWILLGAIVYLYLLLFILPATTKSLLLDDQLIYLLNATRMLDGKMIYRDFFQFTTPGTEMMYFVLFKAFGPRAWVTRAVLIALGTSLTWVTIVISRKVVVGRAAYAPAFLFLLFPFAGNLDGDHHWFSVLAVMAALVVVIERRSLLRTAAAGALCGLALWFTQVHGISGVLAFATFLVWEGRRKKQRWQALLNAQTCLFGAFFIVVLTTNAYFVWKAGWQRFLYCTATFGLRYYSADSRWNTLQVYMAELPEVPPVTALPLLARMLFVNTLSPIVYVLFLLRHRQRDAAQPSVPWDRLVLLNTVGLYLFLGVVRAPSYNKLCSVSIPALIILVWLAGQLSRTPRAVLAVACGFTVAFLCVVEPAAIQLRRYVYLDTPSGSIAYPKGSGAYDHTLWMMSRTHRGDYFFEAGWPMSYFLLGLKDPAKVPYVTSSDYTRPEQVSEVIESLQSHHVRYVVWDPSLEVPGGSSPSGDHLGPLRKYLREHYHVVKIFVDFQEVWERKQAPELDMPKRHGPAAV